MFKGRNPGRNNTVTHNTVIEQVNSFHYSGNLIFYEKEADIDNKLNNHLTITENFKQNNNKTRQYTSRSSFVKR